MTDAPERIWVEADYDHGWSYWRGEWFSEPPGTECEPYVRADLLEAQAALIAEARAIALMSLKVWGSVVGDCHDPEQIAEEEAWADRVEDFIAKTESA